MKQIVVCTFSCISCVLLLKQIWNSEKGLTDEEIVTPMFTSLKYVIPWFIWMYQIAIRVQEVDAWQFRSTTNYCNSRLVFIIFRRINASNYWNQSQVTLIPTIFDGIEFGFWIEHWANMKCLCILSYKINLPNPNSCAVDMLRVVISCTITI